MISDSMYAESPDTRWCDPAAVRRAAPFGDDPGDLWDQTMDEWRRAMAVPHVRGLLGGRAVRYPADGDVERTVSAAASIVGEG